MSEQTPRPATRAGGRRAAGGRSRSGAVNPLTVLAVLLPLLTVAALLLVRTDASEPTRVPPRELAPVSATLLCPSGTDGSGGTTRVGLSDPEAAGEVTGADGEVALAAGSVVTVPGPVIVGAGPTAAGLAAVHTTKKGAALCTAPRGDVGFTGVGAGAEHRSTLELTNPDVGVAVADVLVLGVDGPIDVPALRGVSVPPRETLTLDLARVMPQREDVALQVLVSRGRLGVVLADSMQPLGTDISTTDWLAPATEPSPTVRLTGLGEGRGERVLTVANPGPDAARVEVRIVTDTSEFAPTGVEELRVHPGAVATLDLSTVLGEARAASATGLVVIGTQPVTAGLRSLVDGDLVRAVVGEQLSGPSGMPLPGRAARLVLSGARVEGVATVRLRAADGTALDSVEVSAQPGHDSRLTLPERAAWVEVDPAKTGTTGAVELGDKRAAVLPLVPLVTRDLVPSVRPGV